MFGDDLFCFLSREGLLGGSIDPEFRLFGVDEMVG